VIGGPVPDAALAARLEAVSKAVPGITGVQVKVWVPSSLIPDDPLSKKVAELMKPEPPAAPPVVALPPATVPPVAAVKPVARAKPATRVVAPEPRPAETVTSNRGPDGLLLDPVAPTGTGFRPTPLAPGAAPLPYTTIPPPNVPAHPPEAVADATPSRPEYAPVDPPAAPPAPRSAADLDDLRADPRFAGLTVEIADGVAVIAGRAAGGRERSWALAQAVRKLPGVERVLVRQP